MDLLIRNIAHDFHNAFIFVSNGGFKTHVDNFSIFMNQLRLSYNVKYVESTSQIFGSKFTQLVHHGPIYLPVMIHKRIINDFTYKP